MSVDAGNDLQGNDHRSAVNIIGLTKSFAGARALDDAELDVRQGEVHALLGTNGSGKSTLIKILAGFHKPDDDSAEILIGGEALKSGSPKDSRDAGLCFIHQDLGLIDTLTVEENFNVGEMASRYWISDRREQARIREIFGRYDIDIDPSATVATLSPTQRSIVAIIRAVENRVSTDGVLVLDEPTAALPNEEVHQLFGIVNRLKASGMTIIYVSHRMPEILQIADRVTVLRDGRTAATADVVDLNLKSLIRLVLGFELTQMSREGYGGSIGDVRLAVSDLKGSLVRGFACEARAGEVVGLTGVLGSGYEEVLGLIFGATNPSRGQIVLDSRDITGHSAASRIDHGLAYAPADRRNLGSMPLWSLRENLTLPRPPSSGFLRWMSKRREAADSSVWLERMGVVPSDPERLFATMSGGNQQKVVMGRWLRVEAQTILLDEPTNGVDAAAKQAIHAALRQAAANGAAVMISSSDIEELIQVCDRVLILEHGKVREELGRDELSDENLNTAVMGHSRNTS